MPTEAASIVQQRKEQLLADLERDLRRHQRLARIDYRISLGLVCAGLTASALAGILGLLKTPLLGDATQQIIGGLALIPAGVAVAETTLKLTQKATWRYRRRDGIRTLQRRLNYPAGEMLTSSDIASVAEAYSQLETKMTQEWETGILDTARRKL